MFMSEEKRAMSVHRKSRSYSSRSTGVLLLVGVVVGATVGGVGVTAASSTKTVTVCANKKTNILRYAKSGKCAKSETKVVLNQTGPAGPAGTRGATGPAGPQGEAGTAGANGATGPAGPQGETGTAGTTTNSQIKNICGVNGTTACAVGLKGPGGGYVFMTPSTPGNTSGLFYEAAPSTWHSSSGDPLSAWCNNATDLLGVASSLTGTGAMDGAAKTAVMLGVCTSGAANLADAYTATVNGVVYGDWFLPSKGELSQMYVNRIAIGGFYTDNNAGYRSSSESLGDTAWTQWFNDGLQVSDSWKGGYFYVRPVRAFGGTLACADGGVCAVGATGPSGGIIFFKDLTRPAGSQYFEVACAGWSDGTCGGNDLTDPETKWGCYKDLTGADGTAIGTGAQNTTDITASVGRCETSGIAARLANDLTLGGQSDWFLPSLDELNQIHTNLHSASTPLGSFSPDIYWSSSEFNDSRAWYQHFNRGSQLNLNKNFSGYVRPVRAF